MIEGGRWLLVVILILVGLPMLVVGLAEISGLTNKTIHGEEPAAIVRAAGFKDTVLGLAYLFAGVGVFKWSRPGRILAIVMSAHSLLGALLSSDMIWLAVTIATLVWLFHPAVSRRFSETHSVTGHE